jgi:hypothetical protein
MPEFKTGDRIEVAGINADGRPRYFLAELDGRVYYRSGKLDAYHAPPSAVSAYVEPWPFKVGDRIAMRGGTPDRIVYTVMAIYPDGRVFLAYFIRGKVEDAYANTSETKQWERVSDETAKPPTLRDRDGRVWRPTGRSNDAGEPYYTYLGNPNNRSTRDMILAGGHGPLTEVADA